MVNDRIVEYRVISPGVIEIPVEVDGFATFEVKIK